MQQCFVIQPFDGGERYDKRYEDLLKPAIIDANLLPYRVDEDPGASDLIAEIERRIRASTICLAEICTDNPNVWFELGYAFAMQKPVVMVCSNERRGAFPFDVQHRPIIIYSTDSPSDFVKAQKAITAQLVAKVRKREQMGHIPSVKSISSVKGLEQYEIAGLVTVAEEVDGEIAVYQFYNDMRRAGYTGVASTLARKSLTERSMLEDFEDESYGGEPFDALRVTSLGITWLRENHDQLVLKVETNVTQVSQSELDDDLPF